MVFANETRSSGLKKHNTVLKGVIFNRIGGEKEEGRSRESRREGGWASKEFGGRT